MELIKTNEILNQRVSKFRKQGHTIGLVPTMGALHNGHLSIVEKAGKECDVVVVSIFVNPTQFNDTKDMERYPRTLESDMQLLGDVRCELLFVPAVKEIYPEPDNRIFDFGSLDKVMEGKHRPGHFNGVAQVVSRLFDIVKPDMAFFGLKDFQQLAIIRQMVRKLNLGTKVVDIPTVREADGLAMSSRNRLLSKKHRKSAPLIAETLFDSCNFAKSKSVSEVRKFVEGQIGKDPNLNSEYFEIVDGHTLQPVDNWDENDYIVGCIAVLAGKIRLIDNVIYKYRSNEY
jgi:pantoate--beta-alanine ligase